MENIVTEKRCSKCGEVKPKNLFYFDKSRKDKLTCWCIACYKFSQQNISQGARDRKNAKQKEKYYQNIDSERQRSNERVRRYAEKNRKKINEKQNKVRLENIEKARAYQREFYWKNRDAKIQQHKDWMKKSDGKNREYKSNRRAKILQVGGKYTAREFKELCEKYHSVCLSCKLPLPLVADHVIPLSKGGANSIDNIQPLCRHCNASKYTKHIDYRY